MQILGKVRPFAVYEIVHGAKRFTEEKRNDGPLERTQFLAPTGVPRKQQQAQHEAQTHVYRLDDVSGDDRGPLVKCGHLLVWKRFDFPLLRRQHAEFFTRGSRALEPGLEAAFDVERVLLSYGYKFSGRFGAQKTDFANEKKPPVLPFCGNAVQRFDLLYPSERHIRGAGNMHFPERVLRADVDQQSVSRISFQRILGRFRRDGRDGPQDKPVENNGQQSPGDDYCEHRRRAGSFLFHERPPCDTVSAEDFTEHPDDAKYVERLPNGPPGNMG